jgi:beta-aspartyl-dipeptidase (metallo-type)
LFIKEIIGIGEVAISDERCADFDPRELAKTVHEAHNGGMLARKCGLTHFHIGEREQRLAPLRQQVEEFSVDPTWLYITHVERSEALMREAIELARGGAHLDIDVVDEDLPRWLRFYLDNGGDPGQLTVSSDAAISSPRTLYDQLRVTVLEHGIPLDLVLSLVTTNPARILKLENQGTVEPGKEADLVVLDRESLDVLHVHARGGWLVRDGAVKNRSRWLEDSKREVALTGDKSADGSSSGGHGDASGNGARKSGTADEARPAGETSRPSGAMSKRTRDGPETTTS